MVLQTFWNTFSSAHTENSADVSTNDRVSDSINSATFEPHPRQSHSRLQSRHLPSTYDERVLQLEHDALKMQNLLGRQSKDIEMLTGRVHRREEVILQRNEQLEHLKDQLHVQGCHVDQLLQENDSSVKTLQVSLHDAHRLLETKTLELGVANKLLTTADGAALSDVIRMTQVLNTEMYQFAAILAEECASNMSTRRPISEIDPNAVLEVQHRLGSRFCTLLQAPNTDPALGIQVAVLGDIACFCEYHIACWYLQDVKVSACFRETYERFVREGSTTFPFGPWRSLTRAQLNNMTKVPDLRLENIVAATLAAVLQVSGYAKSSKEIAMTLLNRHSDRLSIITRTTLDLNRMIGEQIVSVDLQPILVAPETLFDPSSMEDAYGIDGPNNTVLCTAALGIGQVGKALSPQTVLLKPKVVLEGTFEAE